MAIVLDGEPRFVFLRPKGKHKNRKYLQEEEKLVKRAKGNQVCILGIVPNDVIPFKITECKKNVHKTGFYTHLVFPSFVELALSFS